MLIKLSVTTQLDEALKALQAVKRDLMNTTDGEMARLKAAGLLDDARDAATDIALTIHWIESDLKR